MTGSATYYTRDADAAAVARERLDRAAESAAAVEAAQRALLADLVELWPTSAWLAAGATSPKKWLLAYTHCSEPEAHRLERLAGLCHRHPALADALLSGVLSLARAHTLATAANVDRQPWLADSLHAFLRLNRRGCDDDGWAAAVRHWASLVDQERDARRIPAHSVVLSQRLFGGGQIHGDLSPNAFSNVATALDEWTDDPDPKDAPYQRSLGERRADALDDMARASHHHDHVDADIADDDGEWEDIEAADTFDGFCPTDDLDEHLAHADDNEGDDDIDLRTLADLRDVADLREVDDLEDLVLRGDGWNLTRASADQLLCDTTLTADLRDGKGRLLDANDAAEQWTRKQRRAIAARDNGCVFPGCGRPPRHCDIHHLHHRNRGGPTRTNNGAMLCRFHHRLLHHHGWQLAIQDGHWTATDPHGTHWTGQPTPIPATRGDPP